jgi:rifampicin phosphotransferase
VDIHNPRWSENPQYVLDLVRAYLRSMERVDPLADLQHRAGLRERLTLDCRRRLRNPLKRSWFNFVLRKAQAGMAYRENFKSEAVRLVSEMRKTVLELGERLRRENLLEEREDVFFLEAGELKALCRGKIEFPVRAAIMRRKVEYQRYLTLTPPPVIIGDYIPESLSTEAGFCPRRQWQGLAVSSGIAEGNARIILRADTRDHVRPGEILVAPFTDPGWTPYFLTAAAIVMDLGGMLSHGSIVAREYGIPAVVNVGAATQQIKTGQRLRVDGNAGVVTLLDDEDDQPPA